MSATIENTSPDLLTIRITGKLTQEEWPALQKEASLYIERQRPRPVRILVITERFEGWERGDDWGDVSFQAKYDNAIQRMAIIGDKRWEDLALMFTAKGFRPFPIEYFEPAELGRAQAWLTEAKGPGAA